MVADSDSRIAWHRVQIKKNREAVKALRFAAADNGTKAASTKQAQIAELKRKISQSERCIAEYERRTRRPLATDERSLANVSWSDWNGCIAQTRTSPR